MAILNWDFVEAKAFLLSVWCIVQVQCCISYESINATGR
jgi:hypothetical protein